MTFENDRALDESEDVKIGHFGKMTGLDGVAKCM
jgi:hypothetical protein